MARKKKSYNPLKMWGSYVGAGVVTLSAILSQSELVGDLFLPIAEFMYKPLFFILNNILGGIMFTNGYLSLLTTISYGFLIGWGIHSLFRRFRK